MSPPLAQGAEGCADGLPAPAPAHPLPGPGGVRGEEAGRLLPARGGHPRQPHQASCRDPLQVRGLATGDSVTVLCGRRGTRQLDKGVIFSRDSRMTVPSLEQLSLEDHLEIARKVCSWLPLLLTVSKYLARCGAPSWCWSSPRDPGSSSVTCWWPRCGSTTPGCSTWCSPAPTTNTSTTPTPSTPSLSSLSAVASLNCNILLSSSRMMMVCIVVVISSMELRATSSLIERKRHTSLFSEKIIDNFPCKVKNFHSTYDGESSEKSHGSANC